MNTCLRAFVHLHGSRKEGSCRSRFDSSPAFLPLQQPIHTRLIVSLYISDAVCVCVHVCGWACVNVRERAHAREGKKGERERGREEGDDGKRTRARKLECVRNILKSNSCEQNFECV